MPIIIHVHRLDGSTHPVDIESLPYELLPKPRYGKVTIQYEASRTHWEEVEARKYRYGAMTFLCRVTTTCFRQEKMGMKIAPNPLIAPPEIEYFAVEVEGEPASGNASASAKKPKQKRGRRVVPITSAQQKAIKAHEDAPDFPISELARVNGLDEKGLRKAIDRHRKRNERNRAGVKKPVKPS